MLIPRNNPLDTETAISIELTWRFLKYLMFLYIEKGETTRNAPDILIKENRIAN